MIDKGGLTVLAELTKLLDLAISKELFARAFYMEGQNKTDDPAAKVLMKELADEEQKHAQLLRGLKDKGWSEQDLHPERVSNLMISDYLTGGDKLEGAGLQDTLIFAMKREQGAVEFYSNMMGILKDKVAKQLCQRLVTEELKHKLKLEILYDEIFYAQD